MLNKCSIIELHPRLPKCFFKTDQWEHGAGDICVVVYGHYYSDTWDYIKIYVIFTSMCIKHSPKCSESRQNTSEMACATSGIMHVPPHTAMWELFAYGLSSLLGGELEGRGYCFGYHVQCLAHSYTLNVCWINECILSEKHVFKQTDF